MLAQMLLLPLTLTATGLAGTDPLPLAATARVSEVQAGVDGQAAIIQASTRSPREAPAAVVLTLSPMAGAPSLPDAELRPAPAGPAEAMWRAEGLTFEGDAQAASYPVELSLWGADARPLAEVRLTVSADGQPCGEESTAAWGEAGQARARLHLAPDGRSGTVEVGLSTAADQRVAGVRVRLLRSGDGPRPQKQPAWAVLSEVRQAWTASVPLPVAGAAYQVDAVVEDHSGRAFGRAHASAVHLDGPPPVAAGACPWPADGLADGLPETATGLARR